jgi:hypothetical protein
MRALGLALAATLAGAAPGLARSFENCSTGQVKSASAALDGALELALRASAAVADTPDYARWFGSWTRQHGEMVRANLKAIHGALKADEVKTVCLSPRDLDCKEGTFAYVIFNRPQVIHVCPSFFAMPTMADARAGRGELDHGTREGTVIHELSHFPLIAATEDHCYSRPVCDDLAEADPRRAIDNADSYQYFAEDVMLRSWAEGR